MTNWDIFAMAMLANLTGQLITVSAVAFARVLTRDVRGRRREARRDERNT